MHSETLAQDGAGGSRSRGAPAISSGMLVPEELPEVRNGERDRAAFGGVDQARLDQAVACRGAGSIRVAHWVHAGTVSGRLGNILNLPSES